MAAIDLNADLGEGFGRWSLTDDAGRFRWTARPSEKAAGGTGTTRYGAGP